MSIFAVAGVYDRSADWILAGTLMLIGILFLYPMYFLYLRYVHTRRIKQQLITSMYKVPMNLRPPEFSFIFSTKMSTPQIFSTLLDLANRSVLIITREPSTLKVKIGPKVDNDLSSYEKMLLGYVNRSHGEVSIEKVIEGFTNYEQANGKQVHGSRKYVFWWLLRDSMIRNKVIHKKLFGKYTRVLLKFSILQGLLLSTIPIVSIRFLQMVQSGKIDASVLESTLLGALLFWIATFIPFTIISFFILRFRGRMLGRSWVLTDRYKRYLGQFESFREFVRLSCKNNLSYHSDELNRQNTALARPFAVALGYKKDNF